MSTICHYCLTGDQLRLMHKAQRSGLTARRSTAFRSEFLSFLLWKSLPDERLVKAGQHPRVVSLARVSLARSSEGGSRQAKFEHEERSFAYSRG